MDLIGSLKTLGEGVLRDFWHQQKVRMYREGFRFLEQKLPGQMGPLRQDFEFWLQAWAGGLPMPEHNKWAQMVKQFPALGEASFGPAILEVFKDALAHFIQEQERRAADVPVVPPPIPVVPPPLPVMGHDVKSQK